MAEATPTQPNDWPAVLHDLSEDGEFVKCLKSSAFCEELIHTAHTELGIPKLVVRAVFKLVLIPTLFFVGKAVLQKMGPNWIQKQLLGNALVQKVFDWLGGPMKTKIEEMRRENKLDDLLEGRRTAAEVLAEKDGNVDFQLACLSLSKMDELAELFRGLVGDQPLLTIPVEAGAHRYHFRRRQVTFQGRVEERRQLEDFLFSPESFSLSQRANFQFQWWLLTGPGGAGKSRLALELCIDLGLTRGRCGFLSSRQLEHFPWETWQPESLTVLVIDYVSGSYEHVLKLVQTLNQRKTSDRPLQNPVRLLLLEREAQGPWWNHFSADNDVRASAYARDAGGTPTPIALIPLGEELHWEIIAELHRQARKPLPNREETLAALARIDPQHRPLFSVFAGYALVEGQHIRDWDATQLLNFLLLDEKKVWERSARDSHLEASLPLHLNLLALTTLCAGLYEKTLLSVLEKNLPFLPALEEGGRPVFSRELYKVLSDVTTREGYEFYEPLQPDIFGEYMLLHDFLENQELVTQKRTDRLINEAWLADSVYAGFVMMRIFNDFPTSTGKERIHQKVPETQNEEVLIHWTDWTSDLVNWYGERAQWPKAYAAYQQVVMFNNQQTNPKLLVNQAMAATNLVAALCEAKLLEEAHLRYNQLVEFAEKHPIEPILTEQGKAAYNLINTWGTAGLLKEACLCYGQLSDLARKYIYKELFVRQALAAVNIVKYLGDAGWLMAARAVYDDLAELASQHFIKQLLVEQAKTATNLAVALGEAGELEKARLLYAELVKLAGQHPLEEVIEQQARTATCLVSNFIRAGQQEESEKIFENLIHLQQVHPYPILTAFLANSNFAMMVNSWLRADKERTGYFRKAYFQLVRECFSIPECREVVEPTLKFLPDIFGRRKWLQSSLRELGVES